MFFFFFLQQVILCNLQSFSVYVWEISAALLTCYTPSWRKGHRGEKMLKTVQIKSNQFEFEGNNMQGL